MPKTTYLARVSVLSWDADGRMAFILDNIWMD